MVTGRAADLMGAAISANQGQVSAADLISRWGEIDPSDGGVSFTGCCAAASI